MQLDIQLFGIARTITGQNRLRLETETPLSVADFKQKIFALYPDFARLNSLMIALNAEYAEDEQLIQASDEIALIPPVSGG